MHHPLHHFVDGAVPAGGQDQVRAARDGLPGKIPSSFRASGGHQVGVISGPLKKPLYPGKERRTVSAESARTRVIDNNSIPIRGDSDAPIPFVKL